MNAFEINKIAGAVLMTALIAMGVSYVGNFLVPEDHLEEPVVTIGLEGDGDTETTAAGEGGDGEQTASAGPGLGVRLADADPAAGESVAKKCVACHDFNQGGPNKVGPNLWGVVGRPKGSVDGFNYSDAVAGQDGEWSYQDLDAFLQDPKAFAPGTKMTFKLRDAEDRADVIAYLRTLGDNPPPLPPAE